MSDGHQSRVGYQGKGSHIIYEEISPLALSQRLNRLRFACYSFASTCIAFLLIVLGFILLQSQPFDDQIKAKVLVGASLALSVFVSVYWCVLMVRRLHDIGHSGWLVLVFFGAVFAMPIMMLVIPVSPQLLMAVSLVIPLFMLYLMAAESSSGMNTYGTPNPPNSGLVMFFGGLYWVLVVSCLLADVAVLVFSVYRPDLLRQLPPQVQELLIPLSV